MVEYAVYMTFIGGIILAFILFVPIIECCKDDIKELEGKILYIKILTANKYRTKFEKEFPDYEELKQYKRTYELINKK